MAGWQELVEGRSDAFRAAVRDNLAFVNCWSTNGAQAETPYRLANAGYPVVLSNVGNFYMDLAYSNHPDERGLGWGGYVDDQRAFSMQPWNIYASQWRDDAGARVDNSRAGEGLAKLTTGGAANILGLQGQLWSETIRNFDMVTYYLFPKMLGLVERAWNASPEWSGDGFLKDYSRFNASVTVREMPWWAAQGLDFRLPPPGIYVEDGVLYANSSIAGAGIRYTTDGSEPTSASTLWTGPVPCSAARVKARLFYLGHESVTAGFTAPHIRAASAGYPANYAREPRFKALVWYTKHAEPAHVEFAERGVEFFRRLNYGDGFVLDVATDTAVFTDENLSRYDIVVMLNASPGEKQAREAFERYMENGGGWMGFHAAAYNDRNTGWPWLVDFLGGGVFLCNNWPPQPVKLDVDDNTHAVTRNLPAAFIAPESEWYQWGPSPRETEGVKVLISLSPDNYPLGIKDVVRWGDWPVVWTNTRYRMIYLNTGHNGAVFSDATQNLLFVNAFRWVVSLDPKGDPFEK
jgi:type 1 glutamine amidotransferase